MVDNKNTNPTIASDISMFIEKHVKRIFYLENVSYYNTESWIVKGQLESLIYRITDHIENFTGRLTQVD